MGYDKVMLKKKIEKLVKDIVKQEAKIEHPTNPEFADGNFRPPKDVNRWNKFLK